MQGKSLPLVSLFSFDFLQTLMGPERIPRGPEADERAEARGFREGGTHPDPAAAPNRVQFII